MNKQNELSLLPDQYTDTSSLWWDEKTRVDMMADKHIENALLKLQGLGKSKYDAPDWLKTRWITALVVEQIRRRLESHATKID